MTTIADLVPATADPTGLLGQVARIDDADDQQVGSVATSEVERPVGREFRGAAEIRTQQDSPDVGGQIRSGLLVVGRQHEGLRNPTRRAWGPGVTAVCDLGGRGRGPEGRNLDSLGLGSCRPHQAEAHEQERGAEAGEDGGHAQADLES